MAEPDLEAIVYVSSAVRLLELDEILHILKRSRLRNAAHGVSGVLLYVGGNFMQYLEGPKSGLETIYEIIHRDETHSGIIQVSREAIQTRQFGDWSMGFQSREFEGYVGSPQERKLIEMILDLPEDNPSTARIVLNGFWRREAS